MRTLYLIFLWFPVFLFAQSDTLLLKSYFPGTTIVQKEYYVLKSDTLITQGAYLAYHPNGKLFLKGQYQYGKRNGAWISYYDNGNVESKTVYCNGNYCGIWSYYSYSGKLESNFDMDRLADSSKQVKPAYAQPHYVSVNVEYPVKAIENGIQGRVTIMVVSDSACHVSVQIDKGIDYECDMAALKAVKKELSKMTPPCKSGVSFIPVNFKLD